MRALEEGSQSGDHDVDVPAILRVPGRQDQGTVVRVPQSVAQRMGWVEPKKKAAGT